MCAFAAPLKPNAGTVLDGAVLEFDTIVTADLESFRRPLVGFNLPPVDSTRATVHRGRQKHGAHRGWVDERGKRVFWTLYILDRWLSCLMGRPPTILDDAIRLPLPCDVPSMPSAAGLRAHVELSRISGHIVCNTYRIAPWKHTTDGAAKHVDEAMHMLGRWINNLPKSLQLSRSDEMTDDPAVCMLHMAYNQV